MGRYLIKGKCITPLRLTDTCNLDFGGVQVQARDLAISDEAGPIHRGLFLDVMLDASDLRDAMRLGTVWGDQVMDLLAFTHGVAAGPVETIIAFEYEASQNDSGVLQYAPVPFGLLPTRRFKEESFRLLWDSLQRSPIDQKERVLRAIAWARKAMLGRYLLDQFIDCWTGLEVMNPEVIRKHGLPLSLEQSCPKCGNVTKVPWSGGIRFALERTGGKDLWSDLRERRVGLLHGFRPISEVVRGLETPFGHELSALRESILDILNIPEDRWPNFRRSAMKMPGPPRVRIEYTLLNAAHDAIPMGEIYPHLTLDILTTKRMEDSGKRTEITSVNLNLVNYTGQFRPISLEMEADRDPDDTGAKLEISDMKVVSRPQQSNE
jgi:hypothetical protein